MSYLPGAGQYDRITFTYEQRGTREPWHFVKAITLPVCQRPDIIFCGDGLVPGYWFDQAQVRGLTPLEELDDLASEQAFVLANEAGTETMELSSDDPADWLYAHKVTWRFHGHSDTQHGAAAAVGAGPESA